MRLPLPAILPNSEATVLIASISGRALAAAARRAGYRVLVADLFRDADTRALAARSAFLPGDLASGIDAAAVPAALAALLAGEFPAAVVLGSGFERHPDLVDRIAKRWPLAGNDAASIRRVKDPARLAEDCAALGIPHPEISRILPPGPQSWLVKTQGAAGGTHVSRAVPGMPPRAGRYFQRFVPGESISALFVADRIAVHVVGFSRQWKAPSFRSPFRYGGAVRLRRFDRNEAARISGWLSALSARTGLVGLVSADFIRASDGSHLLEINPRPGATLDIFDSVDSPLIEAHLGACRGEPFRVPRFADSMAAMVAYAQAPIARFPALAWPDWTADRQSAGTTVGDGEPVCTIFARGKSAATATRRLRRQAAALETAWQGGLS